MFVLHAYLKVNLQTDSFLNWGTHHCEGAWKVCKGMVGHIAMSFSLDSSCSKICHNQLFEEADLQNKVFMLF